MCDILQELHRIYGLVCVLACGERVVDSGSAVVLVVVAVCWSTRVYGCGAALVGLTASCCT